MRKVYKYPLEGDYTKVSMPRGASIIKAQVGADYSNPEIVATLKGHVWAVVETDPKVHPKMKHIRVFGTGHSIDDDLNLIKHIDTCFDGDFVWHVFETDGE
jgi:hypothetical protein